MKYQTPDCNQEADNWRQVGYRMVCDEQKYAKADNIGQQAATETAESEDCYTDSEANVTDRNDVTTCHFCWQYQVNPNVMA